jgi:hypothetical protein
MSRVFAKAPRRARPAAHRRPAVRVEHLEERSLLAFNFLAEFPASYPLDVVLADVNGDSRNDMIVANASSNSLDVRLGNGNGTFAPPSNHSLGGSPASLVVGDFNNDGDQDIVAGVSDASGSRVSLLKGNGDGSFQPLVSFELPWQAISTRPSAGVLPQSMRSVAAGDLNGDGKLDLVATGATSYWYCPYGCYFYGDGYVKVLMGNGGGEFAAAVVYPLGYDAGPVAIADLTSDGSADVVATLGGGLTVYPGNGAGGLGSPIQSGFGSSLSSLSLGDIDGDGFLDTILRGGAGLTVQKGQGNGTFTPSTSVNAGFVDSAVVGDVNADGKLDLVAMSSPHVCTEAYYYCYAGYTSQIATVVLGTGQGNFAAPVSSNLGTIDGVNDAAYFGKFALADLNGNGRPELAAADFTSHKIVLAEGIWPLPNAPFLSIENATVVERDAGNLVITLTASLSKPYTRTVRAAFQTVDGSATAGSDYQAATGNLVFAPGQTTQTLNVVVKGDRLLENNESFSIHLSNLIHANLGSDGSVTILENEPRISIDHAYGVDPLTVVEGDGGTTPAVFTVTLSAPYDQEVTVDYYTLTGHTSDIVAATGTVRFAPGDTSETIEIQVVNDLIDEPLEAFNVYLTNPSTNAAIVNFAGYSFIEDNDPSPQLTINNVSRNEGRKGITSFTFTLTLSTVSENWISVDFATADGTATSDDDDYLAESGSVSIGPGRRTATFTILVRGDRTKEEDETFFVNLLDAGNATILDNQGLATILNDDTDGKT